MLQSEAKLLGIKELHAKTAIDNIPSQKVLEKRFFQKVFVDKDKFIHYSLTL